MKKSDLIKMLAKYPDDQEILIDHPSESSYMEIVGVGCTPDVIKNDHDAETSTNIGDCILLKMSIPEDTENYTLEGVSAYARDDLGNPSEDTDPVAAYDRLLSSARIGQRIEG